MMLYTLRGGAGLEQECRLEPPYLLDKPGGTGGWATSQILSHTDFAAIPSQVTRLVLSGDDLYLIFTSVKMVILVNRLSKALPILSHVTRGNVALDLPLLWTDL